MNPEQQQAYLTEVYQKVFKDKETGSDAEIAQKIEAKVARYFAPVYEQWSNNLHYNYEAFIGHVSEVNSRSDADFAIEFLSFARRGEAQVVTVRTVVTDTASGDFLSGVVSSWAFNEQQKMLWCKETLFDTRETDGYGEDQDPRDWPYDVKL